MNNWSITGTVRRLGARKQKDGKSELTFLVLGDDGTQVIARLTGKKADGVNTLRLGDHVSLAGRAVPYVDTPEEPADTLGIIVSQIAWHTPAPAGHQAPPSEPAKPKAEPAKPAAPAVRPPASRPAPATKTEPAKQSTPPAVDDDGLPF